MYNAFIPNITRREKAMKTRPQIMLDDGRKNFRRKPYPVKSCIPRNSEYQWVTITFTESFILLL